MYDYNNEMLFLIYIRFSVWLYTKQFLKHKEVHIIKLTSNIRLIFNLTDISKNATLEVLQSNL